MEGYKFFDENGTFIIQDPDLYSYLYFPVGAASGMMAAAPALAISLAAFRSGYIYGIGINPSLASISQAFAVS